VSACSSPAANRAAWGGADKSLLPLAGRPILGHVIERLGPQVTPSSSSPMATCLASLAFAFPSCPQHRRPCWPSRRYSCGDRVGGGQSPTRPICDLGGAPPHRLSPRISSIAGETLVIARSEAGLHPVFGLWPVSLAADLEAVAVSARRKCGRMEACRYRGAARVRFQHGPDFRWSCRPRRPEPRRAASCEVRLTLLPPVPGG
jgi:molybdopterin-guanine dinucleotide biosynthesis protein A